MFLIDLMVRIDKADVPVFRLFVGTNCNPLLILRGWYVSPYLKLEDINTKFARRSGSAAPFLKCGRE